MVSRELAEWSEARRKEATEAVERQEAQGTLGRARRVAGVIGVFVFGLMVVFCVIAVAAMANAGQPVGGGFWMVLVSLPVNTLWLGKCWRMMWAGVGE